MIKSLAQEALMYNSPRSKIQYLSISFKEINLF